MASNSYKGRLVAHASQDWIARLVMKTAFPWKEGKNNNYEDQVIKFRFICQPGDKIQIHPSSLQCTSNIFGSVVHIYATTVLCISICTVQTNKKIHECVHMIGVFVIGVHNVEVLVSRRVRRFFCSKNHALLHTLLGALVMGSGHSQSE